MDANYVVAQAYLTGLRAEADERRRARAVEPPSRAARPRPSRPRPARPWAARPLRGWLRPRAPMPAGDVICRRAAAGARA